MKDKATVEFSRPVDVSAIPDAGLELRLQATDEELAALARRLDVLGLRALTATLRVARWKAGGIHLSGPYEAEVLQTCVITLDPLARHYRENVERYFLPARRLAQTDERASLIIDAESDDPPDAFSGSHLDLGEIVTEALALALDPYPRKDAAEIDPAYRSDAGDSPGREGPFAALASLKRPGRRE